MKFLDLSSGSGRIETIAWVRPALFVHYRLDVGLEIPRSAVGLREYPVRPAVPENDVICAC